ncbi:MAG: 30S ribosomal protein S18 [Deltaproteobacteria bacterium]|nr:30S ribosomal protein S18 [Deltaproteobacteria bacterium]MCZ6713617.1 30S ribosomal protein S18 [Deltaproteobacteria bacterium]MCZ6822404.1 30S ribosomal protein S18 [Deltaproteobacteria bacterium]
MVEIVVKRPMRKRKRSGRKTFLRQKVCRFCADKEMSIDYKDARTLRIFVTERHKIIPRRISGNCARHQRGLTVAIKRARQLALMPFTSQHS